jgi:hypothetical protein
MGDLQRNDDSSELQLRLLLPIKLNQLPWLFNDPLSLPNLHKYSSLPKLQYDIFCLEQYMC